METDKAKSSLGITGTPGIPQPSGKLFLASFLALYFEMLIIRYISTEVQVFGTLKNLPLIASFFGIGIGMIRGKALSGPRRAFVTVTIALFAIARFGARIPQPTLSWEYNLGFLGTHSYLLSLVVYLVEVLSVLWLTVMFFVVLGIFVGENFASKAPLRSYAVNLAGSLAGILVFTLLSFLRTPPTIWLVVGFALLSVFFWRQWLPIAAFAAIILITAIPQPGSYWSPYHRIDLSPVRTPSSSEISGYSLRFSHMWYQTMVNLSPAFLSAHPADDITRGVRDYYELPYRFVTSPRDVLVVGAGTGNDVAAALRHNAEHVDAVEIDPVILGLGQEYHPEHPYQSPRVTAINDDARAYFQKCKRKYDLIVFGYLDSSTLLASSSPLRLDNYVYTRESFVAARKLLTPDGTLVLSFAVSNGYVADRLFATLDSAFGVAPRAFATGWNTGTVFLEGSVGTQSVPGIREVTADLDKTSQDALLSTDSWPFLYLENRRIPASLYLAMLIFVASIWFWQRDQVQRELPAGSAQFFLLGVGFLLLEARAVTQLSLLFGSTWFVAAVVVTLFLTMALTANLIIYRSLVNENVSYCILLALILMSLLFPYSFFLGLSLPIKVLATAIGAALPVFFSGIIFSSAFKRTAAPASALGINMLGAVVGGVLENAVMIGGIKIVGVLALMAYGGSWFSLWWAVLRPSAVAELDREVESRPT